MIDLKQNVTPRQAIALIGIILLLAALYFAATAWYLPYLSQVSELEPRLQAARMTSGRLSGDSLSTVVERQYMEVLGDIEKAGSRFFSGQNQEDILMLLAGNAARSGVRLTGVEFLDDASSLPETIRLTSLYEAFPEFADEMEQDDMAEGEGLFPLPVRRVRTYVTLQGTRDALLEYIRLLEDNPRRILVSSFSLTSSAETVNGALELIFVSTPVETDPEIAATAGTP